MRTAIVSDLHLGSLTGRDLVRDPSVRAALVEEVGEADRVVLLGDVLELLERPLREAFEEARPFFEELGAALAGRSVLFVPGNHDHRLAEPLLERLGIDSRPLGLEQRQLPVGEGAERLAKWLGPAELELAYPGVWLRPDVYATHGHYMDCYRRLPRIECLAAAAMIRATGRLPALTVPEDYERALSPIYGLAFSLAQAGVAHRVLHPADRLWRALASENGDRARRLQRTVLRGGLAGGIWTLNRVLASDLTSDLGAAALSATGIAAATELASRMRVGAAHVITGHTHRSGPGPDEHEWPVPGGGRLHNTGSWILTSSFEGGGSAAAAYRPGTVTWVAESGAPWRTQPLAGRFGEEPAAGSAPQAAASA
jgi:hypothetical protein